MGGVRGAIKVVEEGEGAMRKEAEEEEEEGEGAIGEKEEATEANEEE